MRCLLFSILLSVFLVPVAHTADIRAAIAPSPDYQGEGSEFIISWDSLAGKLYNVEGATQLDGNWSALNPGPIVAQSGEATYRDQTTSSVRFYRVRKLDTEPPEVVHLNPADGAIAVGRQEPLTVQLWDEAGIAWESIAFSTAAGPIIGIGDPRLSFSDNVLMYVPGSGEYHGDYGESVAVTLSVSDKLGYRLISYTWTFRLELETVLASNVVLIDEGSHLALLSLNGDTYTFSYTGDAPGLSPGHILVSTDPDNPYKRRVLDIADHPEFHTVDVLTEAVPLAELFEQGSIRASYALSEQAQAAPLLSADGEALLKGYRIDLTGEVIYEDSHIKVQVTSGAIEFVPELTVAADLNGLRLTSFDAEVTGSVNLNMTVRATAQASGTYEHATKLKTFRHVFLQFIGPVPVWEEVVLEFNIGFAAEAELSGWIEAGFTSSNSLTVGATLRDGSWNTFSRRTGEFSPRTPQWQISGGVKLQAYVEPKLTVYLESLVGPSVNLRPYLDLEGYFQANPFAYDCGLYAGLTSDLAIELRGWDDDWGELPSWRLLDLRWTLWHESYPGGWESPKELVNSIGMKFRLIQPGSFMMGAEDEESDERPIHGVTLTKGFYMSVYELTQEQWEKVMGSNPSSSKGAQKPVELVSWADAQEFARRLSEKEKVIYRLPTEAEWEYACRAGTTTRYYWGDDPEYRETGDYAWYWGNSGATTHPVGEKKPNAWGLYDMSGNVWEWCEDWYGSYSSGSQTDPRGPAGGSLRVFRGGGWDIDATYCRSPNRAGSSPSDRSSSMGFRLVRTIQ